MGSISLFKTFCLEQYKERHQISGKEALRLFDKNGVLSYLNDCYEPLHTQGAGYIVDDIDKFIQCKKEKNGWDF